MNIADLEAFLSGLQPVHRNEELVEEIGDLTAHLTVSDLQEVETRTVVVNAYEYPVLLSDCSVDVQKNGARDHLFRITPHGVDLNQPAFRQLGEETDVDGPEYESSLSSHIAQGREDQLIDTLVELLYAVETQTSHTIDFSLILDKDEITRVLLNHASLEAVQRDDLNPHFWYDTTNLTEWLTEHAFASYGTRFFTSDRMPVLIYFQNSGGEIEGTRLFPVFQLTDDITITNAANQAYQDRMATTGDNTTFRGSAPIITPALFADSPSLTKLFVVPAVYSIFSVFADRVTQRDGQFEFGAKHGPESLETVIDIDEEASQIPEEQVDALRSLYLDFAKREDRDVFVGFWRRSVVQRCSTFIDLPTAGDDIRDHYQFIEAETVEGNFDDLSDAIRDTHAFMTDITAQVADTTAALSNEIQRLVFTLLGAILANLFLIIRWGNIDMVIPFSLFVVSAILVFYFPLIDRRIEELDEMKAKGEEDYETYNELITGFTGEAFDFSQLERRKDEYMDYADERLDWARRNLRRIHVALVFVGFGFVVLATIRYPPKSPQIALSGGFVIALGYLTVRVLTTPYAHSYYKIAFPWYDRELVDEVEDLFHINHLPLIIGIASLILILLNALTLYLPLVQQSGS